MSFGRDRPVQRISCREAQCTEHWSWHSVAKAPIARLNATSLGQLASGSCNGPRHTKWRRCRQNMFCPRPNWPISGIANNTRLRLRLTLCCLLRARLRLLRPVRHCPCNHYLIGSGLLRVPVPVLACWFPACRSSGHRPGMSRRPTVKDGVCFWPRHWRQVQYQLVRGRKTRAVRLGNSHAQAGMLQTRQR